VEAPCGQPSCRARLMNLISTLEVRIRERLVGGSITRLPSIVSAPRRSTSAFRSDLSFTKKCTERD
jgi:hypothetical protein